MKRKITSLLFAIIYIFFGSQPSFGMQSPKLFSSDEFTTLMRRWFIVECTGNGRYKLNWKQTSNGKGIFTLTDEDRFKYEYLINNLLFYIIDKCYNIYVDYSGRVLDKNGYDVACKLADQYLNWKMNYHKHNSKNGQKESSKHLEHYNNLKELIDNLKLNKKYNEYLYEMSRYVNNDLANQMNGNRKPTMEINFV